MSSKDDSAGFFRTRASHPMHEALQLRLNAAKLAIKVQDKRSQLGRLVFLVGQARMDGIGVHGGSRQRVRGRPDYTSPGIHYIRLLQPGNCATAKSSNNYSAGPRH